MRSTARRTAEGPLIILPQNNTPWPQHEMSVRYHNILIRWTFAGGLIARGCATEAREDRRAAHETTSSEDRERRGRDEGETRGRRRSRPKTVYKDVQRENMGTGKESRNYTKIRPVSLIICLCGRVGRFGMGLTSIDSASWLSSTRESSSGMALL